MEMNPVDSGLISHIGFEDGAIGVTFKSGHTYHYPADEKLHEQFLAAESKATFFQKHIRPIGHSKKIEAKK